MPNLSLTDVIRFLQPGQPALALAGAGADAGNQPSKPGKRGGNMMFASGGSDDDNFGGFDEEPFDDEPQNTRRAPGAQRGGSGGSGNGGSGGSGGRQRSVQFQPEERYWTEYLRIALPIIGLLLMIGLFWFWASQLTDDGNDPNEPVATQPVGTTEIMTPESTPVPTEAVIAPPTTAPETPESTPEDSTPSEETPVDETGDGTFAVDDSVVITDDEVNMRDDATIDGNIVTKLDAGEVLTIQDGPFEADDYVWYEVIVESTGEVGYVVEDFLEPAG